MSENKIVRYTETELEQRRKQRLNTGTNWKKVNALTDDEIEHAMISDPDAAPKIDNTFWDNASYKEPQKKVDVHLQLDYDIVSFFQAEGTDYQNHINAILRTYVKARKKS